MRTNETRRNRIAAVSRAVVWTAALVLLAGGAAQANELGRCFAADVPWVSVLPDGTELQPGELKICTASHYSPVATLHKVYRNGQPVGMYVADRREQAGPRDAPTAFVFYRMPLSGTLVLEALKASGGAKTHTYTFPSRGRAQTRWWVAGTPERPARDDERIYVAAVPR